MNRLALMLRGAYQNLDKEKLAQVEENIVEAPATPTHNKLKTSPPTGGGGPPPSGLPSGGAQAGPQQQLAPQQGAMPPAAPPAQTETSGEGGEQNPQPTPPAQLPLTSVLNSSPSRGGKGRTKASSNRQAHIDQIKKMAGFMDSAMSAGHQAVSSYKSKPKPKSTLQKRYRGKSMAQIKAISGGGEHKRQQELQTARKATMPKAAPAAPTSSKGYRTNLKQQRSKARSQIAGTTRSTPRSRGLLKARPGGATD